ncbi:glucan biosynthesis protein [Roseivivax isoporae]|uniref:Glucan biosynthesis protein G n=1 Tax=Roseivivax isoporae LMG 25204 TaxID=1449351 RepID=X7F754_9RHOB|nr:glucan biosynthesis protein [Roseivivax isoporae]ETX27936.1 glucan biosynthesis protein G [Roseivivax isoporae LMG 25204]
MHRRTFLNTGLGTLGAVALSPLRVAAQGMPSLLEEARALAAAEYAAPSGTLAPPFADLNYDRYRAIRPLPGRAGMLPLGNGHAVDLLPPGLYFPDPVDVEIVGTAGTLETVPFSPGVFSYDTRYFQDDIPAESPGAGFTGLRLRTALNAADVLDEFLVMQGGTYFRAIGRQMVYGLSSRAIAIGTGGAEPEEFPRFTRIRLHAPQGGEADPVRLEAVIDSPSLAGYLDMSVRPDDETRTQVSLTVIPRRALDNAGIAALTSMYFKGALRNAVADDFRPRVHDSDVLMMGNGSDELLWRPISNPARVETSTFSDRSPGHYGLYQTARSFEAFQDAEAHYHDRPSARVEPRGDWGEGSVVLVEIPTADEFMDNVVAFWRPSGALEAGQERSWDYDIVWTRAAPPQDMPARIVETRIGRAHDREGVLICTIDVAGAVGEAKPEITATGGAEVSGAALFPLPGGQLHRVSFMLAPGGADSAELRMVLRNGDGAPVAPVWLHRWTPARDGGV